MTPEQLQKFLDKHAIPQKVRDRVVSSRRYNLNVFEIVDGEKEIVETIEYLTMRQAREMKKAYREEDGMKSDIVEDVTTDRNGNEIVFTEKPEHPIVCGKTEFDTPPATDRIIERDRRNHRSKASFIRKASKPPKIKRTESDNFSDTVKRSCGADPKSSLHEMYLDNVKRKGITVVNKITGDKFVGLQDEVVDYLVRVLNSGFNKNDLDISFSRV